MGHVGSWAELIGGSRWFVGQINQWVIVLFLFLEEVMWCGSLTRSWVTVLFHCWWVVVVGWSLWVDSVALDCGCGLIQWLWVVAVVSWVWDVGLVSVLLGQSGCELMGVVCCLWVDYWLWVLWLLFIVLINYFIVLFILF